MCPHSYSDHILKRTSCITLGGGYANLNTYQPKNYLSNLKLFAGAAIKAKTSKAKLKKKQRAEVQISFNVLLVVMWGFGRGISRLTKKLLKIF